MCYVTLVVQYGCVKEMKSRVGSLGAGLKLNGVKWYVESSLFADDTVVGRV